MIDINGWICIREAFNEQGEDSNKLSSIYELIKTRISEELDYDNEHYFIRWVNGQIYLTITVAHNHKNETEHVFDFYKWIASIAIGSFGLLYVSDDEDSDNENEYKVWRMKKGKVDVLDDPFLSPIIPEVEE